MPAASTAPGYWHMKETSFGFVMASWATLALLNVLYVALFSQNLPFVDDFGLLIELSGFREPDFAWFWNERINEHRMPVTRAVMWGLARLSNNDLRYTMLLSSLLFSVSGLIAVLALRWERGRSAFADVIVLVFTMSWIHWWHLLQGLGLTFALHLFLVTILISAVHLKFWNSRLLIAPTAVALLLLPVNGGWGFILGAAMVPFVVIGGSTLWRRAERGDRPRALILALVALLMTLLLVAYARAGLFASAHGAYVFRFDANLLLSFLKALSMAAGTLMTHSWGSHGRLIGTVVVVLLAAGMALLVRSLLGDSRDRLRALGQAALFLGMLAIAAALSISRGHLHALATLSEWYAALMAPIPMTLYFMSQVDQHVAVRRVGILLLAPVALLTLISAIPMGWHIGWERRETVTRVFQDLRAAHDPAAVGVRYASSLRLSPGNEALGWALGLLKRMEQGPFAPDAGEWLAPIPPLEFRDVPLTGQNDKSLRIRSLGGGRVIELDEMVVLETRDERTAFRLPPLDLLGDAGVILRIEIQSNAASTAYLKSIGGNGEPSGSDIVKSCPVNIGDNVLDFFLRRDEYGKGEWVFVPGAPAARYRVSRLSALELPLRSQSVTPGSGVMLRSPSRP